MQERQVLDLVEGMQAGLAGIAADEVVVIECREPIIAAGERDGLDVGQRHPGQELIDHADEP